jgi:uncharacterized damage-inducible protein DinB
MTTTLVPVPLPRMRTGAALALAEETETARLELYSLLPRFPADAFTAGDVETVDNVRGILYHVTGASFSYGCWMRRVLGRLDPEVEKKEKEAFLARVRAQSDAAGFQEASQWAIERYYAALAEVTEPELAKVFPSNWGAPYEIESMMEHALVHFMRHRRQLEIFLGLRQRAELAAG